MIHILTMGHLDPTAVGRRQAVEFALRLERETGCVLADREHSCVIEPEQLQGLNRQLTATPEASGR